MFSNFLVSFFLSILHDISCLKVNLDDQMHVSMPSTDKRSEKQFPQGSQNCLRDTWGMPNSDFLPIGSGSTFEENGFSCLMNAREPTIEQDLLVWYFQNTADWRASRGFAIVGTHDGTPYPKYNKTMNFSIEQCAVEDNQGGYVREQIGPFQSTGGYDWWQATWEDAGGLSHVLSKFPDGIYIVSHMSSAVTPNGEILGYPPIHMHHVHHQTTALAGPKALRDRPGFNCILFDQCPDAGHAVEHHGDWQCMNADGGSRCLFEKYAEGYGKFIDENMRIFGVFNDVRESGSPLMSWYYQFAYRWVPRNSHINLKPMWQIALWNPSSFSLSTQSVQTYLIPSNKQITFMWFSGRMPVDGELIRNKHHAHAKFFLESYLFSAHPTQLGLSESRFQLNKPFVAAPLEQTGFATVEEFKIFLLTNVTEFSTGPKPKLICRAWKGSDTIDGIEYDRRHPTCCKPWQFSAGEVFTVVGLNSNNFDDIDQPQHNVWYLNYDSESGLGYTVQANVQNPDVTLGMSGLRLCHWLNKGGDGPQGIDVEDYLSCVSTKAIVLMNWLSWKLSSWR